MRKTMALALLAVAGLASVELFSSYALFRYYAHSHKSLFPKGSAAVLLVDGTINKVRGKHPTPVLSIDHGPLFDASESLGYSLRPGRYRIKEELDERNHVFELTVTDRGTRATSYFPNQSTRRIFMAGDSSMFGWGLNDEQTIPWLIQARLPEFQVVNLSLTSYSTIQALLQFRQVTPSLSSNDIVVIEYHQLSNKLNMVASDVLESLKSGYETELGDAARMREAKLPFGDIDAQGRVSIQHLSLSCAFDTAQKQCSRPKFDLGRAMQVTQYAFDEIMGLQPGRLVILFLSGADDDPVVERLRTRGAVIADLRSGKGIPFEDDVIATDSHMGPFGQHQIAERLYEMMIHDHITD
jgi:hypothetical protein